MKIGSCTSFNFKLFFIFTIFFISNLHFFLFGNEKNELISYTCVCKNMKTKKRDPDFSTPSPKSLIARKITNETASKLKVCNGLSLIGTGSGMMREIEMLAMSFNYYGEVDLDMSRKLLVSAIREYLHNINTNEEIRPYLKHYPFTAQDIEIRVWIFKSDKTHAPVDLGKITYFGCYKDGLRYYLEEKDNFNVPAFHKETYEEALRIVEDQEKKRLV